MVMTTPPGGVSRILVVDPNPNKNVTSWETTQAPTPPIQCKPDAWELRSHDRYFRYACHEEKDNLKAIGVRHNDLVPVFFYCCNPM